MPKDLSQIWLLIETTGQHCLVFNLAWIEFSQIKKCYFCFLLGSFHKKYIKGMKLNVKFTFNRTPLKLMHRALEIRYKVIEEDRLSSLKLQIGTHLDPLLDKESQDIR